MKSGKKFKAVGRGYVRSFWDAERPSVIVVAVAVAFLTFLCLKAWGAAPIVKKVWMFSGDYGVVGDSANELTDWEALLAKAQPGTTIYLDTSKTYLFKGGWALSQGITLDLRGSTIITEYQSASQAVEIGSDCRIINGTVESRGAVSWGAAHGGYGTGITIGNYMTGAGQSNIILQNLTIKSHRPTGNVVFITGGSYNIILQNCKIVPDADSSYYGALIHWGGASAPTVLTRHPHDILIQNCQIDTIRIDSGSGIGMSAAYGITVQSTDILEAGTAVSIMGGDYGFRYADTGTYDSTEFTGGAIYLNNVISYSDSIGLRVAGKSSGRIFRPPVKADNFYTYSAAGVQGNGFYFLDYTQDFNATNCKSVGHLNGVSTGANVSDITFGYCEFKYASGYGAYISYPTTYPDNVVFNNCWFWANNNGIYASSTGRLTVNGCVFDSSYYGVNVTNPIAACDLNLTNNYVRTAQNNANSSFLRLDTSAVMVKPSLFLNNRTYTGTVELVCVNSEVPLDSILTVKNMVRFDTLMAACLRYPLVDGTYGQMVTTDGAGNLTFTTPPGATGGDDILMDSLGTGLESWDIGSPTVFRKGANITFSKVNDTTVQISSDVSGSYVATAGDTMTGSLRFDDATHCIGATGKQVDTLYYAYLDGYPLGHIDVVELSSYLGELTVVDDITMDNNDIRAIDSANGRIGVFTQSIHPAAIVIGGDSIVDFRVTADAGGLTIVNGQLRVNFGGTGSAYTVSRTDHTQSAATITSGTLATDYYSAYSDLDAEGKIGTGSAQVAAGDHTHTGLHTEWHSMTDPSDHTGTPYRTIYIDGGGFVQELVHGSAGKVLTSAGASANPTWETPATAVWTQSGTGETTAVVSPLGDTILLIYPDTTGVAPESTYVTNQSDMVPVFGRPEGVHRITVDTVAQGSRAGSPAPNPVHFFLGVSGAGGIRYNDASQVMQYSHDSTYWYTFGVIDSSNIAAGVLSETDLSIDGDPTDEYVLTWEASSGTGGQMKWEAQSGGGSGLVYTTETDSGVWSKFSPLAPNTGIILNGGDVIIGDPGLTTTDSLHVEGYIYFEPGVELDSALFDSIAAALGRFSETGGSGSADTFIINTSPTGAGTEYSIVANQIKLRPSTGITFTRDDSTTYDMIWISSTLGTSIDSTEIGADQVNDLDINFGTGTDQVSTDDVTEGSTNKYNPFGTAIESAEITNQTIDGDDIDSTASPVVFSSAFHVNGAQADSAYVTANTINDSLNLALRLAGGTMTGNIAFSSTQTVDGIDISTIPTTYAPITPDSTEIDSANLREWVADKIGGMVTGNTETNITVTYDDADNTLDFVAGSGGIWAATDSGGVLFKADTVIEIKAEDDTTWVTPGQNNILILGDPGLTQADSLHVLGRIYFDPLVPLDSATWDSMVNLTGRYAGGAGGGLDSAEVMTVIRDTTYIDSALTSQIVRDTGAILYEPLDANLLHNDEIDASAELFAIMDDETGSATGALLVFNIAPTFTGQITADSIDAAELKCDSFRIGSAQYLPADFANWNTAYGWGNHASAGYTNIGQTVGLSEMDANSVDSTKAVAGSLAESDLLIYNPAADSTDEFALVWDKDVGTGGQMRWKVQAGGALNDSLLGVNEANLLYLKLAGGDVDSIKVDSLIVDDKLTVGGGRITGNQHLRFTVPNPNAIYALSPNFPIWDSIDAAITITRIHIILDADPTTEIDYKFKYADSYIGMANAVTIEDSITVAGRNTHTAGIDDATVPQWKSIYLSFDANPSNAIKYMAVDITYDYD